jgi:hypothetical protein
MRPLDPAAQAAALSVDDKSGIGAATVKPDDANLLQAAPRSAVLLIKEMTYDSQQTWTMPAWVGRKPSVGVPHANQPLAPVVA